MHRAVLPQHLAGQHSGRGVEALARPEQLGERSRFRDGVVVHQPHPLRPLGVSELHALVKAAGSALVGGQREQVHAGEVLLEHGGRAIGAGVVHHQHPLGGALLRLERSEALAQQLLAVVGDHDRADHAAATVVVVPRPPVDVVVPFRGSPAELHELRARMARVLLGDGDSIVVVDNTPGHGSSDGTVPVVGAAEVATPGYARNRGAERGSADWLVFVDADVAPSPDLLERYFEPPPGQRTALLAGGLLDEAVSRGGPPTARYAYLRRTMDQRAMGHPKTANVAVRRSAFEAVAGFREDIRAAEDADLTYRLQAEGGEVELRDRAVGVHSSRRSLSAFLRQKLVWGAGSAWLDREYPGSAPGRRLPGLAWWAIRAAPRDLLRAARARDRDGALMAVFIPLELLAYEVGRFLSNKRLR